MENEESPVAGLTTLLAQTGSDYLCASTLPDTAVFVQFLGRFQNRMVAWDATLYTLTRYYQDHPAENISTSQLCSPRPFIDITPSAAGRYSLKVGLDLPTIDAPFIKKTIIMIRNYKRLRLGRFGWEW